MDNGVINT